MKKYEGGLLSVFAFSMTLLMTMSLEQFGVIGQQLPLTVSQGFGGVCSIRNSFDASRHKTVYKVGVLAIRGFESAYDEFNKTFTDYLTLTAGQQFDPPVSFVIKPLNFNLLFSDVEESAVDFIYVNPSAFSCIESEYTARSLVSQISTRNVGGETFALNKFGGVIATRWDRDDIRSIRDLRDKVIAAASISGLGSGQMQFLEMQRAGISYINDPKQLVFTSNQGKVVNGVLTGDFDVGFIRTDQIERTTDVNGNPVNVSAFKIIEPRVNYIDGVPFPFTASTPLYPEWNVAVLDHVAEDVSREVQTALIALADHARVGRALLACNATHGDEALCVTDRGLIDTDTIRCDTTPEIALAAVTATEKGKYSGWQTTLSYMQLRSMQEGTCFIRQEEGTNIWRCVRSEEIYDAITCPSGFSRKGKDEVTRSCSSIGLDCGEGFQCLCSPCTKMELCYDGVMIRGNCVPFTTFLPSLLVPIFLLIFVLVHFYIVYKRKMADSVWDVKPKELTFYDPSTIIGFGTFGCVHLAEYRGTQVAVKKIISAGKSREVEQPDRDVEMNPGLRSVAYGKMKIKPKIGGKKGTVSHSTTSRSLSRKDLKNDLIHEMRQLSRLRHPCITTIMGAVINGVSEPMLIMEYMVFGSLYDVLRDMSLQRQIEENQMQMLQDIARGIRFLHAANPQVIHGDLKSKNVLIDANFHAKVSDFGLSVKRRSGASGTPFWMAPELLELRSHNTAQSDIFAYGILMFEIFARSNPYDGEDADETLEQICDRSINKRPIMPVSCPMKIREMFAECVKWDPDERPTAEAIDLLLRVEGSVKERIFRLENLNRDLAQANSKIETASAMQLQHFACMSHEIRTPLNCIVGISSLMEDSELSPEHQENVKMIVSSGKLLRQIVDDVLDYSKLESGAMVCDVKEANLEYILTDSVNSLASSYITKKRNISVKTLYDVRLLPNIITDGRRLQQILYNLLSNAVKFSKSGGIVELSVTLNPVESCFATDRARSLNFDTAKRILRISVKDYGKGIEQSEFENIFHPFTQTRAGISNTEGGTGLGLSITRKLVESLGGVITVDSDIGQFSTFTVYFPHSQEVADVEEMSRKLRRATFLLIEKRSTETEQMLNMFRVYKTDCKQFGTIDELKQSWGSTFITKAGLTYICLVQCNLFDKHAMESLFGQVRYEIVTFGGSKGLEKSSLHFPSLTARFPACFMNEMQKLTEGSQRTSYTKLPSVLAPDEEEPGVMWKELRVLVAEDNMVNQKVCKRLLNRIGIERITVVPNGQQAVDRDAAEEFDIVLMDMQMPVMGGVEATRLIVRRNGPHPIPKIIFLSAHVSDSFKKTCLESGAVGYVPKPCTLDGLKSILKEIMLGPSISRPSSPARFRRAVHFDEAVD